MPYPPTWTLDGTACFAGDYVWFRRAKTSPAPMRRSESEMQVDFSDKPPKPPQRPSLHTSIGDEEMPTIN